MNAKVNYLTILSEDNYALGRFYEAFFHMRPAGANGPTDDVHIGDGHIGLNIKPRLSGHAAQLDQFGIETDDVERVIARLNENYPEIEWLQRSGGASITAISSHDPAGNVFFVSQVGMKDCGDVYVGAGGAQDRLIDHFALRVLGPEKVAEFYAQVFGFQTIAGPKESRNFYLSDGHVTLVIIPWQISDFEGTGITARGMDHIGFKVESIATLKADIDRAAEKNHRFRPSASVVGRGKEGKGRLEMFRKACPLGCHHMADLDGLLLDVTE
ncbi:MAG: VOC family protein [Alphaproteobacteria bacterium]|nr:VOC family protein [Alphaproteobacteria bacterium]